MPSFGRVSTVRRGQLHPALQDILDEAILHYDFSILCGYRGEAEQNAAYAMGQSKARWGESKHNTLPSHAVDVAPYYRARPHIRWNDKKEFYYLAGLISGIAAAKGIEIRWGGRFNSINDLPHMELI